MATTGWKYCGKIRKKGRAFIIEMVSKAKIK